MNPPKLRLALALAAAALGACATPPSKPNVESAPEPQPPLVPGVAAPRPAQPAPPYFSIEVGRAGSAEAARHALAAVAAEPHARAERRRSGWLLRIGAWPARAEAEAALPALRARFGQAARVLRLENPVDWLLPDGSVLAFGAPAPDGHGAPPELLPAPPRPAAGPPATAAASADFTRAAADLDEALRRRLRTAGAMRPDGFVHALDVAPLLLYAAQARDQTLYLQLLPSAQSLVLTAADGGFARGFVARRRSGKAAPEETGAAEALWLARALWAGAQAFGRHADRDLAVQVLDGYARYAFELQGVWLVRNDFALGGAGFAGLSLPADYHADFLDETESTLGRPSWQGFAERAYAVLERSAARSGLLYPVIQPEVGATYPGLGVEVYAPNGMASLEQSCLGAEGAARGLPRVGRGVLGFVRERWPSGRGRLAAYYHVDSGEPQGRAALRPEGYACLARLAVALADDGLLERLDGVLAGAMRDARESGDLSAAGQLLLAARARNVPPRP